MKNSGGPRDNKSKISKNDENALLALMKMLIKFIKYSIVPQFFSWYFRAFYMEICCPLVFPYINVSKKFFSVFSLFEQRYLLKASKYNFPPFFLKKDFEIAHKKRLSGQNSLVFLFR